jgi:hypothetical protein
MRLSTLLKTGILTGALCLGALGQDAPVNEAKGMPPRTAPTDYQAHGQAGTMTIGAEFTGHSVATPEATFSSEEFVSVEMGLFGPADSRVKLSAENFSLRVNGKKTPLPNQPFGMVLRSLKDPEWVPPDPPQSKSKGGINTGGGGQNDPPPVTPHMPMPLVHVMQQRVQKAALPEGDRALPVAGLIFFRYGGKTDKIDSLELIYDGPAGKATLALHP